MIRGYTFNLKQKRNRRKQNVTPKHCYINVYKARLQGYALMH